jgi:hypothetical protein
VLIFEASSAIECWRDSRVQICGLGAHFVGRQDWLFFLLVILESWLNLFRRWSWGKPVRVMQRMFRIIHVDYILFLIAMRASSTMAQRASYRLLLAKFHGETHLA